MPVEYSGISNEHLAVRTRAGVFDVSHMGEIEIAGKNALAAVQLISSNDAALLQTGQAQYAALTTPDGTFVDDMLVYRMAPSHFMVVVNAANTAKAFAWISEQVKTVGDVAAIDSSNRYALIAVQGPAAREVLQPLTGVELADIGYYRFGYGEVAAARRRRPRMASRPRLGSVGRPDSLRSWSARHVAPRSRDASLRQRHRRDDDRARGRARVDDRLEEGEFHRARSPSGAEGARDLAQAGWL
jgi:folate-binding Fe-S cluster repair protein YgfZ